MNAVLLYTVGLCMPIIIASFHTQSESNSIANKSDNHSNTILQKPHSFNGINDDDAHTTNLHKTPPRLPSRTTEELRYKPKRDSDRNNEKIIVDNDDGVMLAKGIGENGVDNLKDEIAKLKGLMKILRNQQVMLNAMDGDGDVVDIDEVSTKKPEADEVSKQAKELRQLRGEVKSLKELLIKTVNVAKFDEIDKKESKLDRELTAQRQEIDHLKNILLKLVNKQKISAEPTKANLRSNNKVMVQLRALEKQLEKILVDNNISTESLNENVGIVGNPIQHFFAGRPNHASVIENLSKPSSRDFTIQNPNRMRTVSNDGEEFVKLLTDRLNKNINPKIKDSNIHSFIKDASLFNNHPIPTQSQTDNNKPRASSSSDIDLDSLMELFDNTESKTTSTELDANAALLNELQKLSRKSKKDDINIKLKKLQKQIKHLQELDAAKSKSLDDDDDTGDQIKKLKLQLKLLQVKESKSIDNDEDDLESNLKSLEKAINSLRPEDDNFDMDMDFEEKVVSNNDKRFQLLINKLFTKNKQVQVSSQPSISQQQIALLIKRLTAGNRPMGGAGYGAAHGDYEGDDNGYGGVVADGYHPHGNGGDGRRYDDDGYSHFEGGYGGGAGSYNGNGGGHGIYGADGHAGGAGYYGGSGSSYSGGGRGGSYSSGKGPYAITGFSDGYGQIKQINGGGYGGGYGSTVVDLYGSGRGGYAAGHSPGGANEYGTAGYATPIYGTAANGLGYGPTAGMYGPYGGINNLYNRYEGYGDAGIKYGPATYGSNVAQIHGSGGTYSKAPTSSTYSSKVNKAPMPSYNPYSGSFDDGSLYGSNPSAGMYPNKNGANNAAGYANSGTGSSGNYAQSGSGLVSEGYTSTGSDTAGGSNDGTEKGGSNSKQNSYSAGPGGQSGYSGGSARPAPTYNINGDLATDYINGGSGANNNPFPGYQDAAGAGSGNSADYESPAAASAANNEQSYQNQATNKQSYTREKVADIQTEIYNIQNVINGFNRPEYSHKPEDKETVYKLNKQIGDLKKVMNKVNSEDGAGADYLPPQGQQPQTPQISSGTQLYPTAANARKERSRVERQTNNDIQEEESREADEMLEGISSFIDNILQKDEDRPNEDTPQSLRIPEEETMPRLSNNPELEQVKEKLIDLRKQLDMRFQHQKQNKLLEESAHQPSYYHHHQPSNGYQSYNQGYQHYPKYEYEESDKKDFFKDKGKGVKKLEKKTEIFDKIITKILDKIIHHAGMVIPKLLQAFFGFDKGGVSDYNHGDSYGDVSGYDYGDMENTFKGFGLSGFLPMIIIKLITNLSTFVTYLKKFKFLKSFLVPALVVLIVGGLLIFLIWFLQPEEESYGSVGYDGYGGSKSYDYNNGYGQQGTYYEGRGGGYRNNEISAYNDNTALHPNNLMDSKIIGRSSNMPYNKNVMQNNNFKHDAYLNSYYNKDSYGNYINPYRNKREVLYVLGYIAIFNYFLI